MKEIKLTQIEKNTWLEFPSMDKSHDYKNYKINMAFSLAT